MTCVRQSERYSVLELCAGGGGQALGWEQAGFEHSALVEIDGPACLTLRNNRPQWTVIQADIATFDAKPFRGTTAVIAGPPCPPFSLAGKKLGEDDERNLFPAALRIIEEVSPEAVVIENVRGLLDKKFAYYRELIAERLGRLGFETRFELLNAMHFKVPQNRPRVFIIGLRADVMPYFSLPAQNSRPATIGECLADRMAARGWHGALEWRYRATGVAPTLVGGSKKHGGPDLGPTRARAAWAKLGVDGKGLADDTPAPDFLGMPRLTIPMVSRVQGFPDSWIFSGRKTAAYRQVGNALPPPLAQAVAMAIHAALFRSRTATHERNQSESGQKASA